MVKPELPSLAEQRSPFPWKSLIFWVVLIASIVLFLSQQPRLWPGGWGIAKDQTVVTKSIEVDANGKTVKTIKTTKYDDGKTLWDWLSLLGVPLSLAILGFWLQQSQQKRAERVAKEQKERDENIALELRERDENLAKEQREIAADETKEEVLQVYFDRLSVLLVDKNLLAIASKVNASETQGNNDQPKSEATLEERELLDSAVDVIRARTLSILRRFENDPQRKTSVIRFLIDAEIVSKVKLGLKGANLSGVDLTGGVNLANADLRGSNLYNAKLKDVKLSESNLNGAVLREAKLIESNLSGANLSRTNLSEANLRKAKLISADLSRANLRKAKLISADLSGAILHKANLSGTNLTGANLTDARFSDNVGLTEAAKADMKARGAIFEEDIP